MKKIKIISYNGKKNTGGVEKVTFYLDKVFSKNGYLVDIIDEEYIKKISIINFFEKNKIKVKKIFYPLILSIHFLLKKDKSIVVSNGYSLPFYKSDYLFIHGTLKGFYEKTKLKKTVMDRILIFYEKMACKFGKNIICVSLNAKKECIKYYCQKKEKYSILNNCVDTKVFFPQKKILSSEITIGFCGRLDENKGIKKLINLNKMIQGTNYTLSIATNNPKNTNLFEKLSNNKIKVGLIEDELVEFYNEIDVMFFPSDYEGFEMVTLEALSCGIPIYANDVGAISELKNKIKEIKIISSDSKNWLDEMKKMLISDYRRRIDLNNIIDKRFGLNTYIKKIYKLMIEKGDQL